LCGGRTLEGDHPPRPSDGERPASLAEYVELAATGRETLDFADGVEAGQAWACNDLMLDEQRGDQQADSNWPGDEQDDHLFVDKAFPAKKKFASAHQYVLSFCSWRERATGD
jgi:hypothetical protein